MNDLVPADDSPPKLVSTILEPWWDRQRGILLVGGRRHGEWWQPILNVDGKPARRVRIVWPIGPAELAAAWISPDVGAVADLYDDGADEYIRELISQRTRAGDVIRQQYVYRWAGIPRSLEAFQSALHVGFCGDRDCRDGLHQWPPQPQIAASNGHSSTRELPPAPSAL